MPANLEWADPEKTILVGTARGEILKDEFVSLFEQEAAMIASVDHTVDIIADFREVSRIPMDFLAVSGTFARKTPPNMKGVVLVGANPILQTIFGIWSKIFKNMAMVKTLEEAFDWIRSSRS